ncbi:MAG: DNA translocase FtsK 4TM domain-containing protein, partial [Lachnospiraceae bacterium]|nr:DNA translocase FtsK 4TM domain-containing protein [Lachnospiraceae bacterium]
MAGSGTKKTTKTNTTKTNTAAKGGKKKNSKKVEPDTSFLQSEIAVLGTFAICVFLFLSNFHICGMVGNFFSSIMLGVFGSIGYLAPVLLFAGVVFYASNKGNIRAVYKMLAVEILLLVLCGLAQMLFGGGYKEGQTLMEIYELAGENGVGGGLIGGAIVYVLHTAIGTIGTYLVLLLCMIISLVCITEKSFVSAVKSGSDKVYQHAKEDYDRHKEIREIKKEEKRQLREEQRVQGVNLNSTDLTKDGVLAKMSASDEEEVAESAAYREAFEREERALRNAVSGKSVKSSADEFTGKITKPTE